MQKYSKKVKVPRLCFDVSETEIVVTNNELGFTEADVRALCNVGSSTKAGGSGGYIGHKGIGFKSCFGVSDCPAIHSNGFHFHLDAKHKIVPHEISPRDVPPMAKKYANETCICLPLNEKMKAKAAFVSSKFADLTPILLLFLNKLRQLKVRLVPNDPSSSAVSEQDMRRVDLDSGVVELHVNDSVRRFAVEKLTVAVPAEVARYPGAATTELALAVSLPSDEEGGAAGSSSFSLDDKDSSSFPVFSYLPVQPYGFKCILQADFLLTSGREAITDAIWNQWLVEQVPDVFLRAVESAKRPKSPLPIQLVLNAIPLENELLSTFKHTVLQTKSDA